MNGDVYFADVNNRLETPISHDQILAELTSILSAKNVKADPQRNAHFRNGWRSGGGSALAVIFPETLLQLWLSLKVCVKTNTIIIMQAANTGLTEGSTPSGEGYDRPVVIINTLAIDALFLINAGEQVISLPGATLHQLEKKLEAVGRAPHSIIGSSCLGASIVGGIANNSGGALVKRGPAYTELSVYAQINAQGELVLVNNLGIQLGDSPEAILKSLQTGDFSLNPIARSHKMASDQEYVERIRDVNADTPSRFNADKRRLFESSGCAGKLVVFAVRLDTFPVAKREKTFYIGTNDTKELSALRKAMLSGLSNMPEVGEYMHRDIFDISQKYGKDTFLSVLHLGTQQLPRLFSVKGHIDAALSKWSWLPKSLTDKCMQFCSRLFPEHIPPRLLQYRRDYEHHLIIKMSDEGVEEADAFLREFFGKSITGSFIVCDVDEAKRAYLHRFAAAGAAIRYHTMFTKDVGDILALDIALPRNEENWLEILPEELDEQIDKKLYYGHFFCYVFHQDYILKKGTDAQQIKKQMLALLNSRGAKYPAEHNVGHLYEAEPDLKDFYQSLDPTNTFNPGVGKMDKTKRHCACCL